MELTTLDNNCPICGSKLQKYLEYVPDKYCKNKCYNLLIYATFYIIEIYGESFRTININNNRIYVTQELKEKIKYWKEDERYVLKILEMSGQGDTFGQSTS